MADPEVDTPSLRVRNANRFRLDPSVSELNLKLVEWEQQVAIVFGCETERRAP
jgi:tRNA C32,U32 (ribose-2'-O)-methylase TrmJ